MHILAIDQGTTSSRAVVFDREGRRMASAQQEFPQLYPRPGWVNHDANAIWESVLATTTEALDRAGLDASDLAAIGIANQRETTVVWDRTSAEPLAPAIVWQSRQSEPWVAGIRARGKRQVYQEITGLPPDAYFSATKLAMLLDEDPELRRRAESGEALFGTVDSWLIWKLTGGAIHATDATNASRTMLFDIRSMAWSEPLLDDLAIPAVMLPEVRPSSGVIGEAILGGRPVLIAGVAGDQHAALFGQACFRKGAVKATYGTGAFMLMNTAEEAAPSSHGLLTTLAWQREQPVYALEGAVFIAGAATVWG
jgi:glycerol kinase